MENPWMNAQTAADYAACSVHTIYKAVNCHELKHTRVGGRRMLKFRREWVDEWLEKTMIEPHSEGEKHGSAEALRMSG
jgi:excisionase family DNA binding protein